MQSKAETYNSPHVIANNDTYLYLHCCAVELVRQLNWTIIIAPKQRKTSKKTNTLDYYRITNIYDSQGATVYDEKNPIPLQNETVIGSSFEDSSIKTNAASRKRTKKNDKKNVPILLQTMNEQLKKTNDKNQKCKTTKKSVSSVSRERLNYIYSTENGDTNPIKCYKDEINRRGYKLYLKLRDLFKNTERNIPSVMLYKDRDLPDKDMKYTPLPLSKVDAYDFNPEADGVKSNTNSYERNTLEYTPEIEPGDTQSSPPFLDYTSENTPTTQQVVFQNVEPFTQDWELNFVKTQGSIPYYTFENMEIPDFEIINRSKYFLITANKYIWYTDHDYNVLNWKVYSQNGQLYATNGEYYFSFVFTNLW
ncbi:hypothetical protein EIN_381120 [Entamoeba invadens IP1]|uniref:Uncharacterized protein n=1 Tax=Entamoeba invadens IP1 TaxID=370355 RepID=A0A0A1UAY6_ENTIV|nr:hypothetical protein EIN_381120 [Entamoeba invadens IP1]ELP92155.1 hypothetical protein EIN_381120 [Entamoeba invadens IP1]|eukprot:XP_004258926.1 hypothetical protein EIN_381120 [Entamoeba invadens IP1]